MPANPPPHDAGRVRRASRRPREYGIVAEEDYRSRSRPWGGETGSGPAHRVYSVPASVSTSAGQQRLRQLPGLTHAQIASLGNRIKLADNPEEDEAEQRLGLALVLWSAVTARSVKSPDLEVGGRCIIKDLVLDRHRLEAPLAPRSILRRRLSPDFRTPTSFTCRLGDCPSRGRAT